MDSTDAPTNSGKPAPRKRIPNLSLEKKEIVYNIYKSMLARGLNVTDSVDYTANIARVCEKSIYRVIREYKDNNGVLKPPARRQPTNVEEKTTKAIQRIVDSYVLEHNELPTIKKVLQLVRERKDPDVPKMGRELLTRVLQENSILEKARACDLTGEVISNTKTPSLTQGERTIVLNVFTYLRERFPDDSVAESVRQTAKATGTNAYNIYHYRKKEAEARNKKCFADNSEKTSLEELYIKVEKREDESPDNGSPTHIKVEFERESSPENSPNRVKIEKKEDEFRESPSPKRIKKEEQEDDSIKNLEKSKNES